MRIRRAKLRAFALLSVMTTQCGCVAGNSKTLEDPSEMILTGRVLSVKEVIIFEGDLALMGYSYIVEPKSQPGNRLVVVGDRSDCPTAGDNSIIYRLRLQRRSMYFGIRGKTDEALMSELFIAGCERIPAQGGHASQ